MTDPEGKHGSFASLFAPGDIICHSGATDRNEALLEILRHLAYQRGIGNVDDAFSAIAAREDEHPTIIGPGIAMPHARLNSIDRLVVGVVTSRRGIPFAGDDGPAVRLIILILTPKAQPGAYLQAVSSLAKICKDPSTAEQVGALPDSAAVWHYFERGRIELPRHVCARDIMEPVVAALGENDTLERAIDLFVRHNCIDVPVVDQDGELVGVVTAFELLRVCLPDYILWMDDLSPILDFQPFAEILRNESRTWLAEIMTMEYATVAADSPAVQVAKEITRQRVERAYVLDGRKLVGAVSLQTFLNKVMRE